MNLFWRFRYSLLSRKRKMHLICIVDVQVFVNNVMNIELLVTEAQ